MFKNGRIRAYRMAGREEPDNLYSCICRQRSSSGSGALGWTPTRLRLHRIQRSSLLRTVSLSTAVYCRIRRLFKASSTPVWRFMIHKRNRQALYERNRHSLKIFCLLFIERLVSIERLQLIHMSHMGRKKHRQQLQLLCKAIVVFNATHARNCAAAIL